MSTTEELKAELREAYKQYEQLEVAKNVEISTLNEKVADLSFQLQLLPVERMASQTPYSKKILEGIKSPVRSPAVLASQSCDEDMAMSQELVETSAPSPSAYVDGLNNMLSYAQQLQHALSQQLLMHQRDPKAQMLQIQAGADLEAVEELDTLRAKVGKLEAELQESEKSRTQLGNNYNVAVGKHKANVEELHAKEKALQEELSVKDVEMEKLKAQVPSDIEPSQIEALLEGVKAERDQVEKQLTTAMREAESLREQLAVKADELIEADGETKRAQEAETMQTAACDDLKAQLEEREAVLKSVEAKHNKESRANELALEALQEVHVVMSRTMKEAEAKVAAANDFSDKLKQAEKNLKNEEASARVSREKAEQLAVKLCEKNKEHEEEMIVKRLAELQVKKLAHERKVLEDANIALATELGDLKGKEAKNGGTPRRVSDAASANKRRKVEKESHATLPSITLSGFREAHQKRELVSVICSLGGELVKMTADTFDKNCSHIVIPNHEARTVKTVAAVLTGKWVMTMLWASDSMKAGRWLDEEEYGYRLKHDGIKEKKVFLTKGFKNISGPERVKQAEQLVEYGGATLVESIAKADIVLRSPSENNTRKKLFNNTWEAFIAWIFPTDWRPACTVDE